MAILMATRSKPLPYSIADARNHLPRLVRKVEEGKTVVLTRRGRLVAYVVSERAYYLRLTTSGAGLREALQSFVAERPRGGSLTSRQIASLRDRGPGRKVTL